MLRSLDGRHRDVRDDHAGRRARARPLRLPPLDELPLGDDLRPRDRGRRRRREATRHCTRSSSTSCRPQRRRPTADATRSCARPSCCGCRSPRRRPRCAPAARSTTRRTSPADLGRACSRVATDVRHARARNRRSPPRVPGVRDAATVAPLRDQPDGRFLADVVVHDVVEQREEIGLRPTRTPDRRSGSRARPDLRARSYSSPNGASR